MGCTSVYYLFASTILFRSIIPCESLGYSGRSAEYLIEEHTPRAKNHRYYDEPYEDSLDDYRLPFKLRTFYAINDRNDTLEEYGINVEENHLDDGQEDFDNSPEYPNPDPSETVHANAEIEDKIDYDYDSGATSNALRNKRPFSSKSCGKCRCGVQRRNRGGYPARPNEFPWIAILSYFGRFYCSGSLINNLYVISAGHCTRGYQTSEITVRLLEYDQETPNESPDIIRRVLKVFRPKGYNEKTLNNDISLLKLSRAVPVRDGLIRPICLPLPRTSFGGQDGILAGWGTAADDDLPSSMLRKAIVPIISNRRCRNSEHGDAVTNKMICARNPIYGGTNICFGDSGGPLMTLQGGRYRLAGITSWGNGCGRRDSPGVYTRITKFNRWIRKFSSGACWCT